MPETVKKQGLPKWGELVFCTITRITPFAAWCTLDEYEYEGQPVEGMIHISEVAGKRVKDIRDFVKPNRQYVTKVVRINYQKGHINLSIKRVSKYDKRQKVESFRKGKRAENILERAAKGLNKTLDQAYEDVGHKLQEQFGDMFSAFEQENESPGTLAEAGISKKWIDALTEIIKVNFKKKKVTIKAKLQVSSTEPDGVEHVRKVLSNLEKETEAAVTYISAPTYRIQVETLDPKTAEKDLKLALDKAMEQIKKAGGEGRYKIIK